MRNVFRTALGTALVCAAGAAFAARPLFIDDADTVNVLQFRLEGGAWYAKECGDKYWNIPLTFAGGVLPSVEVGAGFGGRFQELLTIDESGRECLATQNGMGDLILFAKWQFLKENTWLPRQAIVPIVKFPTASRERGLGTGKTDYDIVWNASKTLSSKLGAHVNVGYAFIGEPVDENLGDILHYGLALDYLLLPRLQWAGEVFAANEFVTGADNPVMGNTGLRWKIVDNLILDAALGTVLAGIGPDLTATAGFTWIFGGAKPSAP